MKNNFHNVLSLQLLMEPGTTIKIHDKTCEDLELHRVLENISQYAITEPGQEHILKCRPFEQSEDAVIRLNEVNEFKSSFENDNRIPNHGFEPVFRELKLLDIEGTVLELSGFRKIASIVNSCDILVRYFEKFREYYHYLLKRSETVNPEKMIAIEIERIIDRFGEVRDDASDELSRLRKLIQGLQSKINSSFSKALNHYNGLDYLDDIRESVVENRRVLAVKAMYRRKVRGNLLGSSKTGSIVYIEPEATHQHQRELDDLLYEEKEEIKRILSALTDFLRTYSSSIKSYQDFLIHLDIIYSKAKFADSIDAILPRLTDDRSMIIRDAYHPLLLINNRKKGEKTYPQTIALNSENRIIVISGPNAGGKSITLKTVGLLQLMLQSGILVPVHERSEMCFFERILSDIGDNQSIENHLSTYSYRLKQMNYFLRKCNDKTLFLIDEFGTGSDPELGGALAETFLEVFYEREAYGVITTHYTNLKMLADEKPYMQNANMLFNERSLKPIFKLVLGEAGSSFTFEVAQKNGIPYSLINRAKKKIERGKVRFDRTIARLQKERSKLERTEKSLQLNAKRKIEETDKLENINARIQQKLEDYQELYDSNQRLIYLGQKVKKLANTYLENHRKRDLLAELFKLVQIENSKVKKQKSKDKKVKEKRDREIRQEVEKKVEVIRKKKKAAKKRESQKPEKPKPVLEVGDRVRLENGRAVGSIDKIEKNKAVVNYGQFTTNVNLEQLELVEKHP